MSANADIEFVPRFGPVDPEWGLSTMDGRKEMARDVFISHASADADTATLLRMHLEHGGISCWMAPRDIPAGSRYAEAILEGIDTCRVFLLLFSAHAGASTHVINEIEDGASKSKPMFVIRLDESDPAANRSISLFLRSHQWFEASQGPMTAHITRIEDDVRRLLDRAAAERTAIAEQHQQLSTPVPQPVARETVQVRPRSGQRSIGIDVDATAVRGCVTDLDHPDSFEQSDVEQEMLAPAARNPRGVLEAVKAMALRLVDKHFPDESPVGIGVALPGQVDVRAGTLKFGPNLYGARNLPFKSYLAGAFPRVPIRVDNDVRCATRAELHLGVGAQFDSFAWIFVGDGVGSGSVVDRRIHFGHNFCAGEIGHMKVSQSGAPCTCGQSGCLETFVKTQSILDRASAKLIDYESRGRQTLLSQEAGPISTTSLAAALDVGDGAAEEVASEVGQSLGLGIANYLNLVNPAAIVVGGPLMSLFFFPMLEGITTAVQRNTLAEVANTPIVQSANTEHAVVVGASLMFHPDDGWPF